MNFSNMPFSGRHTIGNLRNNTVTAFDCNPTQYTPCHLIQMSNAQALRVSFGLMWVQQLGDDPWPEVARWLLHYEEKDTALVQMAWEVWRGVYERGLWRGHYISWKDVKNNTNFNSVFSQALSAQGTFPKAEVRIAQSLMKLDSGRSLTSFSRSAYCLPPNLRELASPAAGRPPRQHQTSLLQSPISPADCKTCPYTISQSRFPCPPRTGC